MKLLRPVPSNRTLESIRNHYDVEKSIADKLKKADKAERKQIYSTMYDELFTKVPDHPRLTRRNSDALTEKAYKIKTAILGNKFDKNKIFAEFAPGDCRFSQKMTKQFKHVYAIDISDQRGEEFSEPDNFDLIIYDGYNIEGIDDALLDVLFSDQLIEHFHPEETEDHFRISHRLLKEGGCYIFSTPHLYAGPQDVSMYFSYIPEGFHLKEWTYRELKELLKKVGFCSLKTYWFAKGIKIRLPYYYFAIAESIFGIVPLRFRRKMSKYFLPSICIEAVKC